MRVEKLEDKEVAGLRAMGFTVDDEGEAATITVGDLSISVMRPHRADDFSVYVELPNGSTLACHAYRRTIAQAAEASET